MKNTMIISICYQTDKICYKELVNLDEQCSYFKISNNEIKQKKCDKNIYKLKLKLKLTKSYEKSKEKYNQQKDELEEEQ